MVAMVYTYLRSKHKAIEGFYYVHKRTGRFEYIYLSTLILLQHEGSQHACIFENNFACEVGMWTNVVQLRCNSIVTYKCFSCTVEWFTHTYMKLLMTCALVLINK